MQRIMRWGNDFCKDKGEGVLTLNQFGKSHVSWGNPIKTVIYPLSCLFFPTIYFCQNMVEVVIVWRGKSMGKFQLGRPPNFECHVLLAWTRKH